MSEIVKKLQGGDLRSIGQANEVVADILADPSLFIPVFEAMSSPDPVIRMRAADAVEKVTRTNPAWLDPFKKRIIEELSQIGQQEVRWHLAQMFPRLELDEAEAETVIQLLRLNIINGSPAVVSRGNKLLRKLGWQDVQDGLS